MPVMRTIPSNDSGYSSPSAFPTVLNFSFVHLYEPTLFIPWRIAVIDSAFFPFIYVSPVPPIRKLVIRLHRFALSASLLNARAIMRALKLCKNCSWISHARYNKAITGADVLHADVTRTILVSSIDPDGCARKRKNRFKIKIYVEVSDVSSSWRYINIRERFTRGHRLASLAANNGHVVKVEQSGNKPWLKIENDT